MKRKTFILLLLIFLAIESLLVIFIDQPLSTFLRNVDTRDPHYIDIFRSYTDIGKSKWWLIISGIGVIVCSAMVRLPKLKITLRQRVATYGFKLLFFFVSVGLSGIVVDTLKPILGRARPIMMDREGLYGFFPFSFQATFNSMPSGHTVTAFAIAAVLTIYFPRKHVLWLLFAAAIGVSRIMVNAHYLSDVFAGALIGYATVLYVHTRSNHNVINHIKKLFFPLTEAHKLRR